MKNNNASDSKKCVLCGSTNRLVASALPVCKNCIIRGEEGVWDYVKEAHIQREGLISRPSQIPSSPNGVRCHCCDNQCKLAEGEVGFCGVKINIKGEIIPITGVGTEAAFMEVQEHVTSCDAAWLCPGGTSFCYPEWSVSPTPEYGYHSLGVHFYGCTQDCLWCRRVEENPAPEHLPTIVVDDIVEVIKNDPYITCISFYGHSPDPHLKFTIKASQKLIDEFNPPKGRILRICYEWNGSGKSTDVLIAASQVLRTGGTIRFNIHTINNHLHRALTGITNPTILNNFRRVFDTYWDEQHPTSLLLARTRIIPGYVEQEEIAEIVNFIASLSPNIPYSLSVYTPMYKMKNHPLPSKELVMECYQIAKAKLNLVNIENMEELSTERTIIMK
ncbi:MAG: radical SAM protein [Candidatus Kariarchaeaceae archaeon]